MECCKEECSVIRFLREPVLSYLQTLDKDNHKPKKRTKKNDLKRATARESKNNAHICLVVYSSIIQCVSQHLDPI